MNNELIIAVNISMWKVLSISLHFFVPKHLLNMCSTEADGAGILTGNGEKITDTNGHYFSSIYVFFQIFNLVGTLVILSRSLEQ